LNKLISYGRRLAAAPRLRALFVCAVGLVVCLPPADGWGQAYPSKPVRMLLPSSPGSGSDTIGRIFSAGYTQVTGQQVIVENRPGAGSNIGAALAAKAPADGYTFFQANIAHAANVTVYRNLQYDLLRDFAPVTQLATSPSILVVHPSLPVKSVADLVKLAKAKPGLISYSSTGNGAPTNIAALLFTEQANIQLLHVPYRGGAEALNAVISGEVATYFSPIATALPQVRQGRLRALAVTSATRPALVPEYPTIAELGFKGYETGQWYGILVPAKTSRELVVALHDQSVAVLKLPDIAKRLNELGYVIIGDQPEQFAAHIKSEIAKLGKVLRNVIPE
jgi:tripartite-type tricarboxylate transporter receptor subunit TctC